MSVIGETKGEAFKTSLVAEADGYFSGMVPAARAGSTYQFRLGAESRLFPDPASRYQPEGPHGPSMVIDPTAFSWTDQDWKGLARRGTVLYELHLGTFTAAGTWAAAIERLPHLADTGITAIEVMPVADFVGTFGWGYDGVNLFAPTRLYGEPDDVRRFVDRAHALGMGVILDVVYNHFGPDGNYIAQFSDSYFTDRYSTDWGSASILTAISPLPCVSSSGRMPPIGSRSFTWMGCGWTPRSAFTIRRRGTFSKRSQRPPARRPEVAASLSSLRMKPSMSITS